MVVGDVGKLVVFVAVLGLDLFIVSCVRRFVGCDFCNVGEGVLAYVLF